MHHEWAKAVFASLGEPPVTCEAVLTEVCWHLRESPDAGNLHLEVLPLRQDAPIYLPKTSWPDFGGKPDVAKVLSVQAHPEYELTLTSRQAGGAAGQ